MLYADVAVTRHRKNIRPYFSNLASWPSLEMAEQYVRDIVRFSLDAVSRLGNRIAFHGVQIKGMESARNEQITVDAVKKWLELNPEAVVTMVDKFGSFNKYSPG